MLRDEERSAQGVEDINMPLLVLGTEVITIGSSNKRISVWIAITPAIATLSFSPKL
jgi:hypothetical protein